MFQDKEADARHKIDKLLEEAGWNFNGANKNIKLEPNIKGEKEGFADYLLLDENNKPFIIIEAKAEDKNPFVGKEQARNYAKSLNAKYIILSNGNSHYFWNIDKGNPEVIIAFPSYESLKESKAFEKDISKLYLEPINNDYVAITQDPDYKEDPSYLNEKTRDTFIKENNLKFLRKYQINAIKSLQKAMKDKKTRFLFEMATGTGKTLVAAAVIKLFLKTENAKRVLFLVDRLELEDQAKKSFNACFRKNGFTTVVFKEDREDWNKAEIVVSTVQTLLANNKYKDIFRPTDFDLVISDEAHRSINGNSRAIFEYFLGYKLGLTATPKDYLKNINEAELKSNNLRAWETRQLLDTYKTFGCDSGEPTFKYDLIDGVTDPDGPFLVNPWIFDARTEITTQMLSDKGYSVPIKQNLENELEDATFFGKDFERKLFSDETNKTFCKTFMENAQKDPITGEIGKTIIFTVSRAHAAKITQILNEFADIIYPEKYNSDFALQITSDIAGAQDYAAKFQKDANNLSGNTRFKEDYKSSRTRVCVTVGMMTTGYDCEDLLNIVLMRPIFSPTLFVQMKGRGTRINTFIYKNNSNGKKLKKEWFYLIDFFGNYEYFENKYDYENSVTKIPFKKSDFGIGAGDVPTIFVDNYINQKPDPLTTVDSSFIDPSTGMKIDRELFGRFSSEIKKDDFIKEQYDNGNFSSIEDYINKNIFDKPEDYFNLVKLNKAVGNDRIISIREMLDLIYKKISTFKSKDEIFKDEFENFVLTEKIEPENYQIFRSFFGAYLLDEQVRKIADEGNWQQLSTNASFSLEEVEKLGAKNMNLVLYYIRDNVDLSKFISFGGN